MSLDWPRKIIEEYDYFNCNGHCLNVDLFTKAFRARASKRATCFIADFPPCFFAGRVGKTEFVLVSLNPGYNCKRSIVERCVCGELHWENTYLTFFDWFRRRKLHSRYYSRFAFFLAGLRREDTRGQ